MLDMLKSTGACSRRVWRSIAYLLATIYICIGVYFWTIQDDAIFKPQPAQAGTPADLKPPLPYESIEIPVGIAAVHGFWLPGEADRPVILFLHGQDTTIGKNLHHAECFHEMGCPVLIIDYRGYGATYKTSTPSEAGLCEDAQAAWNYLVEQRGFRPEQILIYGHSLGGAVAIDLAAKQPEAGGLVVECSFTSVKDIVHWKAPMTYCYPLDWMLRHRFNSIQTVGTQPMPPTLFVHGTSDAKVPCFMSEELFQATLGPNKDLFLIDGGEHAKRNTGQAAYCVRISEFIQQIQSEQAAASQ